MLMSGVQHRFLKSPGFIVPDKLKRSAQRLNPFATLIADPAIVAKDKAPARRLHERDVEKTEDAITEDRSSKLDNEHIVCLLQKDRRPGGRQSTIFRSDVAECESTAENLGLRRMSDDLQNTRPFPSP